MTTANTLAAFSRSKFLEDVKKLADTLGAPYSEPAVLTVLKAFEECFKEATVIWRTTDRPGDTLNYRASLQRKLDTIRMAAEGGFLKPDHLADYFVRLPASEVMCYLLHTLLEADLGSPYLLASLNGGWKFHSYYRAFFACTQDRGKLPLATRIP